MIRLRPCIRRGGPVRTAPGQSIVRLAAALALGLVAVLGGAVGASASPSIDDKRAQAEAIVAEIQSLGEQVGAAAERYNGATYELGRLSDELGEARRDLRIARRLRAISQRRIAERLRELYVNDSSVSTVEVVLGAASLDELLDRIDVAERVAEQDAAIAGKATALRERVAAREQQLARARARQAELVEQRAAEKRWIEGKLAERERLLASVRDEIARLEEEERRRQAELRRQAQLELERQRRLAAAQQAAAQAAAEARSAASAPAEEPEPSGEEGATPRPFAAPPAADFTPPPADASKGAQVVAIAMRYLGTPYVWGSADPAVGFDCSGLTKYVFAQVGVSLPHYAAAQYQLGVPVSRDQLQPGDLVFFSGLGHMGMYIGGRRFIHAPQTGDVVKISSIDEPYRVANWVGARRVL